jgi:hypothetical protein
VENGGTESRRNQNRTNNKMVDLNLTVLITTLNVRQIIGEWNRIGSPEINHSIYGYCFSTGPPRSFSGSFLK